MEKRYHLLYHHAIDKAQIEAIAEKIDTRFSCTVVSSVFKKKKTGFDDGDTVFLMADDDGGRTWLRHNAQTAVTVIILPFEQNPLMQQAYAIASDMDTALEQAADETAFAMKRLLLCNDEVVLDHIVVGEMSWFDEGGPFALILSFFQSLFTLKLRPLHIETAKEQHIETAALIVEAGGEALMQSRRARFFRPDDDQCTRVTALVYAPESILGFLRLRLFLSKTAKNEGAALPKGIGTLKSDKILLRSSSGKLPLRQDGSVRETEEIRLQSIETKMTIPSGFHGCAAAEEKESLRLQNLPADKELVTFLTKRTLPFVPIAPESAFAELFKTLREGAKTAGSYVLLLLVSILMATTGLFQDSSPTIIGAMILAPLMAPVISLSMGLIRSDRTLIVVSTRTIVISVVVAVGAAALYTYSMPFTHLTDEMRSRMHPTLLDLAVAILAGIAAAYGYANENVGKSLAGVAIAVALVPPLGVAGVGIGWGDWQMFNSAFLLFLANIAGIVAAAGMMFYLLGFSSWKYASGAFALKLTMLFIIAAPLYLSTRTLVKEEQVYRTFRTLETPLARRPDITVRLNRVEASGNAITAHAVVLIPHDLTDTQKNEIVQRLRSHLGKKTKLILTYQYTYEGGTE